MNLLPCCCPTCWCSTIPAVWRRCWTPRAISTTRPISSPSRRWRATGSINTEWSASNLILTGRYILQPDILHILATQERGAGGEIQLTDAMIALSRTQKFYGLQFEGRSFDCGSKIGFLAANVSYALEREDIAPGFRAEIAKILGPR